MGRKQVKSSNGLVRELRRIARSGSHVWRLLPGRQKRALGLAVLVMSVATFALTRIPIWVGKMIDAVERGHNAGLPKADLYGTAAYYLGILGMAYLVREAANVLRRYLVENACTRIDKDMCVRVVAKLMRVELATFSREQVGALHGRIHRSVDGYVRFIRISFIEFLPAIMAGVLAMWEVMIRQPRIALVMLGVAPLSLLLTLWQLASQKGIRLELLRSREAMDGTVVEQLTGIDYVRAADTHRQEVRRVARAAERRRGMEVRHHVAMSFFGSGKAINEAAFHLSVLGFAIFLFAEGSIRIGEVFMFSGLFLSVMTPLTEIHRFIDEAHENSLRVGDLVRMLKMPVDRSFKVAAPREPSLDGSMPLFVADNLQVEYPTLDGGSCRALNGVSMTIRHGETIGVAGRSGGGKSTWLKVMMRLTHPCGGRAFLGGVPLEDVSREAIGRMIGYVGQNPFVFAGTVAQNIAYGSEGVTAAEIENAARRACIHDEISRMPKGYGASVSERGQNLSGGQRQRIALARVFLKNPPILILDEGTSALDNISERAVQQAITAARLDRTVILVAHRLSTLLDAGRIFVFDEGRVVETGSYGELVRLGGVFAELVRSAECVIDADEVEAPRVDRLQVHPSILDAPPILADHNLAEVA